MSCEAHIEHRICRRDFRSDAGCRVFVLVHA
jgi:hypothetical protein